MVISNQLNGPFGRARLLTLLITLVLAVNVFIGLASLGCAMAAMANPHACLTQVHVGHQPVNSCELPSIGGDAMTAMAPREPVSMELNPVRFDSRVNSYDRAFFDQADLDARERPPQLT